MVKRMGIVAVGLAMAIMAGDGTQADDLIIGGRLFRHSLRGEGVIKNIANLDKTPLFGKSTFKITEVVVDCLNAAGNYVHGEPARVNVVLVTDPVEVGQTAAEKKRGRGHVENIANTDAEFLQPKYCTSPQWIPVSAEVRETEWTLVIVDDQGADKSKLVLACEGENLNIGDEYACVLISLEHFGH